MTPKRNDLEDYLKQLEDLDRRLNDDDKNINPSDYIVEINKLLSGLSSDLEFDMPKKILSTTLTFVNKSKNPDPAFAHEGESGFDIRADLENELLIPSGEIRMIPTGLYFEVANGLEVQIRSRSGLAAKNGVFVLNSPGTVDCVKKGTMIKTINGDVPVEEIFEIGPREIISFNEENFETENDLIDDIWIVKNIECIEITVDDKSVVIPLTKEVYTKRGWILAKDLNLNDEILLYE